MKSKTSAAPAPTPLMRQYYAIKRKYPDLILLYRMGDFYETFDEDAKITSRVLGITLTSRSNGAAADTPLAGFPYHALDNYLYKLLQAGYRVAICEQVEDPKTAKGVVKREVVEIVSPGTALSEQLLQAKQANYLVALLSGENRWGAAVIDVSTGEFFCTEMGATTLKSFLPTLNPKEILVPQSQEPPAWDSVKQPLWTKLEDWIFNHTYATDLLAKKFGTQNLKGFGLEHHPLAVQAAGAIIYYLQQYQGRKLEHLTRLRFLAAEEGLVLDSDTLRNLEIFTSLQGGTEGTLFQVLDRTLTAAGGRLLRRWLQRPEMHRPTLEQRLARVNFFYENAGYREDLRDLLRRVADLERLLSKLGTGRASPRDLTGVADTLTLIPRIRELFAETAAPFGEELKTLPDLSSLEQTLHAQLVENPPVGVKEGGFIRPGVDSELDRLRELAGNARNWLVDFQNRERNRLGIPSLKVKYNKVFGYFIEVTNTHKERVPPEYIRKQTLVNAERYVTEELKRWEEQVLTAEEEARAREQALFEELRQLVFRHTVQLQDIADFLAHLDCWSALAQVAFENHYVRPELDDSLELEIEEGRHPVVEQMLPVEESFIPNDTYLNADKEQIIILTGPNMAGKSTYLRQVALIVLMAQIGSFVPARQARIGLVDRIFTRVGASDNLVRGESTFMVEMQETANILNNATRRSLIILDEIGRGTSTYDGMSIAWAVVEYLHNHPELAARTLFATHYHELTALEKILPRVKNYNIAVREYGEQVVFLRKIVPGGADKSYGIHVARMAGVPLEVVQRAAEILSGLDNGQIVVHEQRVRESPPSYDSRQLDLFPTAPPSQVEEKLREVDVNRMTPLEALQLINELVQKVRK